MCFRFPIAVTCLADPFASHEIKHDGYRPIARLEARRVRLFSRRGHELVRAFLASVRPWRSESPSDKFLNRMNLM